MKTQIQSVKGTREFYPPEMAIRRWLYALIEKTSVAFGYQEYDGPFIEKIDLYAAKSGEELVKEQAFVFQDRGGDLVTLRPELTLSLARMVAQKQNELVYPLKWWSFGPFWRYEKPQKGRTREFFQWNIDMIGVDSPAADAEMVAICATFFKNAGLQPDQVSVIVNHRKLMETKLIELGINESLKRNVFHLIDRKDKLPFPAWENYALEIGLSKSQFEGVNALLIDTELWKHSPELIEVFSILEALGVREYVRFDPRIIRGLDYYTGIVFEAWDLGGDGRAVMGGGHYDNLVGDVGGDPLPGVGFAMGDVMTTLLLKKYGIIPEFNCSSEIVLVTIFDENSILQSQSFAAKLRTQNIKTICYPEVVKLQKQFKYADRVGMSVVVIIGPDESAAGTVTIKDLINHSQVTCPQETAAAVIKDILKTR
jgi:histidyl-tRNA synthetase